jgi:hypothetical protein
MNDRHDDDRFGELLGETIARRATSVSARPNEEALFARVGARAVRQRRVVAAAAVVLVAVVSLVGYSIGATRDGDSSVRTPVAAPSEPGASVVPGPDDAGYEGPLEHLFTRTTPAGITVRVYLAPSSSDEPATGSFVVAEITNDAAVAVVRAENCYGGGVRASGTFGGPEGSPVQWVIVQSYDVPSTVGLPVRAQFGGGTDEMVPEPGTGGIAVLVAPGTSGTAFVEGPGGAGPVTIGQNNQTTCPPPPVPATLPPAGPQPPDVAAAEAGVRQAYVDVYDNYDPATTEGRVQQALRAAGFTDEQLAAMTVEVGEIRFTDETHAAVQFRLTVPEHADGTQDWQVGYAVFENGQWTQAPETKCDHLRSIGVDCP